MKNSIRKIALFLRQRSEQNQAIETLRQLEEWRLVLETLPKNNCNQKKLALVRLDDIGDYLLFRNFVCVYKKSERFTEYKITLIGNIVWKPLFEEYDFNAVDETKWMDKQQYFADAAYRNDFWQQIRNENFETIICPARTRPLLLDDLIVIASGAKNKIACQNSFALAQWNTISNSIYNELLPTNETLHEFYFNKEFAQKISGFIIAITKPFLPSKVHTAIQSKQVICFIGTAAKSKIWPIEYWIDLVKLLQQNGFEPLLSGGKNEVALAAQIIETTQTNSIVGQTNLVETLHAISKAQVVITGDTMAAHAAVSFNKLTIILANGVNAKRFVAYEDAGFENVKTIYTQQYLISKKDKNHRAVTKDMASIKPAQVLDALKKSIASLN